MTELLKRCALPAAVFVTGACVLIIEVVAVRVLSPYYGNTIFTFSSVISVILAALSIGYYAGGRLADRRPSLRSFFGIILLSGIVLLGFYAFGTMLLPALSAGLSLAAGPLVSSVLLFFLPALLLGTLSPFAVKLQHMRFPERGVGSAAGEIFFWSTLGSIVGSLLAGFVLIPHFGIDRIFMATGVVLFVLGFFPLLSLGANKKRLLSFLVVAAALAFFSSFVAERARGDALYSKDGVYEKVTIFDGSFDGRPARFFQQDRSGSGAMFLDSDDPTDLVYEYTKYYSLYRVFKPDVRRALVIGGGAYSVPKALLAELPGAVIDVSEIEPSLLELSKKYFGVGDDPRLRNHAEDGRRLLADSDEPYDLIFSDVYYSLFSIPAHFTTREFFALAKSRLSEDGIFIANLIGDLSRRQPSLVMAEIKTFQSVFPNSYFFAVDSPAAAGPQNIMFVGYHSDKKVDLSAPDVRGSANPILRSLQDKAIEVGRFDLSSYPLLTDDFSPVEYLTAKVLRRSFSERPLFDGREMLAVIEQQLRYGPRYLGASGHASVQEFLMAEMRQHAGEVVVQLWEHAGSDGATYALSNIIGRLYPEKERRIIVATHYDSKRFADRDFLRPEEPVPGANDSASGVAVLVELARALRNASVAPSVGVDIVFFDGEEGDMGQGSDSGSWVPLGSTYFAGQVSELYANAKPISALVLDMVCDKDLKIYKERTSVQNAPAQTQAFWEIAQRVGGAFRNEIGPEIGDDHTPLNEAGVPSFLVGDFEYPYFHTTKDTVDKCSAKSLETVAHAVFNYIFTLPGSDI